MKELIKSDLRALVRIIAFAIAKSESGADELVNWAYEKTPYEPIPGDYVNRYLRTDGKVSASLKKEFISRFIEHGEAFPVEAVKAIILHMPYEEFLKTPYWKAVSQYVKNRDFNRCTKCGNQRRLQVHHKTYAHHGDELHHLLDLTCLCRDCHTKEHEKLRIHKTISGD